MIVASSALAGKCAVLGVTGSIACYKAVEVASHLTQLGVQVYTVLTASAARFIQPLAFQAVTGQPAYDAAALWGQQAHILHTQLAGTADVLAVVPATAHAMAQLAGGHADSLLLVTALAATCPLLLAPAMDGGMWTHPATQANAACLEDRGAHFIGPETGHLASGQVGPGRLAAPDAIVTRIRALLGRDGSLANTRMVITCGGTREPLDPVRHLGNRSSGKQGLALVQAARDRGAAVTLISTVPCAEHAADEVIRVQTAREMQQAVETHGQGADVLIMAAAVADFRPESRVRHKIKKAGHLSSIPLVPNPDILQHLSERRHTGQVPRLLVGFAAETEDLHRNARHKMERKNLDLIVVNDVSRSDIGFGADCNAASMLDRDGGREEIPRMSKFALAERVLDRVAGMLGRRES